ncbi:MAG: tyrosine-type recombinase/integrase [Planctomycetia bacterium]|nr:tyrosine-type recombinase/integrase [Planctomycetia bacterium]
MAAQINAQLLVGAPAALSFEPVSVLELRQRWLDHHEQILRSSIQTVNRYRTATEHLIRFFNDGRGTLSTAHFQTMHAEAFVRYLRGIKVAPNGHRNSKKRPLLDKGIQYILEACRTMFSYALKRRHMPPYSDNPFAALQLEKMPIDHCRPVVLLTPDQEREFLEACDEWQFPIFATLLFTGMRPGELTHLLLPDDLDLERRLIFIRNKPRLGWKVKTRNERAIPLVEPLVDLLRITLAGRSTGPVFLRRRFSLDHLPLLTGKVARSLEAEIERRIEEAGPNANQPLSRTAMAAISRGVWRDAGAIKTDRLRSEFMSLTADIGLPELTCAKLLRHQFATCLQDANVDPLIRNELMGHSAAGTQSGIGLGMTGVYTHTRFVTKRRQLESALLGRDAMAVVIRWLETRRNGVAEPASKLPDSR